MEIIEYFNSGRQTYWLSQIKKSDWGAGQFLFQLLSESRLQDAVGENAKVLLLTEGDELISFCTYAEKDDIQPTDLTPWIGFVYTFPQYRGHRHAGKLFSEIVEIAKSENVQELYISTDHTGLYEKYGFTFFQTMTDIRGGLSRVYRKQID